MKLTIFILFCAFLQVSAKVNAQFISLSEKNTSTLVILEKIQEQSGYDIFFKNNLVRDVKISINLNRASLQNALRLVLDKQNLVFTIEDNIITIKENPKADNVQKQLIEKIKISVVNDQDKPLAGATIQILGKKIATMASGYDGTTTTTAIEGDTAIRVSYTGFITKVIKIESGKINYRIKLIPIEGTLKDVVITGMFDKPKESFTGAVTVISKEQIKMFGNRNLLRTIANIDPAFNIEERNTIGSNPNALPDISVRGSSSIPSGLTDLNNVQATNIRNAYNLPLFILDGFEVSLQRIMDMNQNDVESVVILKDASSTAAYGARGANGVIVVTSIKPVAGKMRISFTAGLNLEIPDFSSYNLLDAADKLKAEQLADLYTTNFPPSQVALTALYNTNLNAVQNGVNTNWLKIPTQTGIGQNHQLSLSGGDNEFRYTVNGSYNQVTGALKGSKRDNANGGITMMYLLKKIRFSNNLSVGFNNSSNSTWGSFGTYVDMNPYWSPYDENGNPIKQFNSFNGVMVTNPAYNGSLPDFDKSKYTVVRNTTAFDWDIIKGLKWSNSVGFSRQTGSTDVFQSPSNTAFIYNTGNAKGYYGQSSNFSQEYQIRSNLTYGTVIGKSSIYAGLNLQSTESKQNTLTVTGTGFSNDKQSNISQAINSTRPATTELTTRTAGAIATMSYNYDGRYFVDGTYNVTGGSSFGSNSRYGNFWSAGLGWTVSNERFIKDHIPQISMLRLRYNYGVSGGLNFSPYQSLSTYLYVLTERYRNLTGASLRAFGNKDLKWQNTYQQNAGIDLNLFDNWLSISGNYYFKTTNNAITTAYLSPAHGFDNYIENFGKINNYGADINVQTFLIKKPEKNFYWSITASAATNRNVLVRLSDAMKAANKAAETGNVYGGVLYQFVEGKSIDELFVLQSPGVDPATGRVLLVQPDGSVSTNSTGALPKISVGQGVPKVDGRFSTMVRLGQFTANIGFAARLGGKKVNYTLLNKVENAVLTRNVDRRVLDFRWTKPDDISQFKSLKVSDVTYANNRFVSTETTFMLNNINLAYSLPTKWIKRLNLEQVTITSSMSNIAYWSNIEQERGTSYPYALQPSFTLSATF